MKLVFLKIIVFSATLYLGIKNSYFNFAYTILSNH